MGVRAVRGLRVYVARRLSAATRKASMDYLRQPAAREARDSALPARARHARQRPLLRAAMHLRRLLSLLNFRAIRACRERTMPRARYLYDTPEAMSCASRRDAMLLRCYQICLPSAMKDAARYACRRDVILAFVCYDV